MLSYGAKNENKTVAPLTWQTLGLLQGLVKCRELKRPNRKLLASAEGETKCP